MCGSNYDKEASVEAISVESEWNVRGVFLLNKNEMSSSEYLEGSFVNIFTLQVSKAEAVVKKLLSSWSEL